MTGRRILAILGLGLGTFLGQATGADAQSVAVVSAAPSPPEAGAAALAKGVSLPLLVRLGAARSPTVKAARADWQAAIETYPQATALPDPMVRYDYFAESVETRVGPQEHRFGISLPFPFPGTLAAKGRVVLEDVAITRIAYDKALRDLIVDLKLSFYELAYLEGAIEITRQNQGLLDHILRLANTRHAEDKAKLTDVLRAQSQTAQLGYDQILLRELREVEAAKLKAWLDLPSSTPLGPSKPAWREAGEVEAPLVERQALANRQELLMAEHMVRKTDAAAKVAKLKARPVFSLNAMTIATGDSVMPSSDSGKDPVMVGIGMSVPWWGSKNRGRVREAQRRHEAARYRQLALENQTKAAVQRLYFRLENARRLVELYEKSLIPQAEQAMQAAEVWSQKNGNDLAGFLETQSVRLNFNLARLRALTDYHQYQARLERLAGGRLDQAESPGDDE